MAQIKVIEQIPVEMNLGQPGQIIGLGSATKNIDSGQITIEIVLDATASGKLEDLCEIIELKALGFVGIKRDKAVIA